MDPSSPQRMRYYYQATSHQDAAIRQARPHLVHLSEEHCEAMFWFSAYTSLYALAEPLLRPWPLTGVNDNNINDSNESLDPIKELIHSFQLGRGINLIIRQHWDYFQRSELFSRFDDDNRDELEPTLEKDYPQLVALRNLITGYFCRHHDPHNDNNSDSEEQETASLHAVSHLFLYLAILASNPSSDKKHTRLIQTWPIILQNRFLDMCRGKHPVAVLILAHYAVLMGCRERDFWFFRGWPVAILEQAETILGSLGPEWSGLLEWPRRMIYGDDGKKG